ncbi:MAG: hypothetical protein AAFZ65_14655 [Planctomycetota bacterium]
MKKPVEIALLAAGGAALFGVCFVSFARVAGVPLHNAPLIGGLFPAPPEDEEAETAEAGSSAESGAEPSEADLPERRNTTLDIVSANVGLLGGFAIPAPYSRGELEALVGELEAREEELDRRLGEVGGREQLVEERLLLLEAQAAELQALRDEIDVRAAELELRAMELRRDEDAMGADEALRFANLAALYADGDIDQAATDLQEVTPDEAAKILRNLEDDRALEILRAMPPDARRNYSEAWAVTDA